MEKDELGKYTNWQGRKSFAEEWQMVKDVIEEKTDTETIRLYLMPLVPLVEKTFAELHPDKSLPNNTFDAAFMYLPTAIKRYAARKESGKVGFKFSSYFQWFIRQGFLDYPDNKLER